MEQAAGLGCQWESMNEFKGHFDHYLRDNRGYKYVMLDVSSLEPSAWSRMLSATVLGKLGLMIL